MPAEGVELRPREEILSIDEIIRLGSVFAGLGFEKIRITGGEPLVRKGIEHLAAGLAAIPGITTIGITTNGLLLPQLAAPLKSAGVVRMNISLDTLRPKRFAEITRRDYFHTVEAGIDAALAADFEVLRFNVVFMGGVNEDELFDFVEFVADKPACIRFIEYMPFGGNRWSGAQLIPARVIRQRIEERYQLTEIIPEGHQCMVAREYAIDGFLGSIGFITAMSEHFCATCNRMRITADGMLKSCLYFPPEASLRDAMRSGESDADLVGLIARSLEHKCAEHPSFDSLLEGQGLGTDDRSMSEIGG